MMTIYDSNGKGLTVHAPGTPLTGNSVWIDLLQPTVEEDSEGLRRTRYAEKDCDLSRYNTAGN